MVSYFFLSFDVVLFRDVNTAVMELLVMAYALKTSCAKNIIGVIPYFPYSKQCKMRKRGSIVCKLLASMLAKAGIYAVLISFVIMVLCFFYTQYKKVQIKVNKQSMTLKVGGEVHYDYSYYSLNSEYCFSSDAYQTQVELVFFSQSGSVGWWGIVVILLPGQVAWTPMILNVIT